MKRVASASAAGGGAIACWRLSTSDGGFAAADHRRDAANARENGGMGAWGHRVLCLRRTSKQAAVAKMRLPCAGGGPHDCAPERPRGTVGTFLLDAKASWIVKAHSLGSAAISKFHGKSLRAKSRSLHGRWQSTSGRFTASVASLVSRLRSK